MHIGDHPDIRSRKHIQERAALALADDDGGIGIANPCQFLFAGQRGPASHDGVAGHVGFTSFAQKMQVDGVKDKQRLRCATPYGGNALLGDAIPARPYDVELRTPCGQHLLDAPHIGLAENFDAQASQGLHIGTAKLDAAGDESQIASETVQDSKDLDQAARSGIMVSPGNGVIDDQHAGSCTMAATAMADRGRERPRDPARID